VLSTQDTVVSCNVSIVLCLLEHEGQIYSDTRKVSGCSLATAPLVVSLHGEPVIVRSGPGGAAFGAARLSELKTSPWKVEAVCSPA
jgi:hypothetical protein